MRAFGPHINEINFLDIGSGSGRSTKQLREIGINKVVALDLSHQGLILTNATPLKFNASAEFLPFADDTFDGMNLCGVMTNLTDRDPEVGKKLRLDVAKQIFRCLKKGGFLFLSDFCSEHYLTDYPVNYKRRALITKEEGTIAVFNPNAVVSFVGLSDNDVVKLGQDEKKLMRFARHYSPKELIELFGSVGVSIQSYTIEVGKTPSGTPIENIILVARK